MLSDYSGGRLVGWFGGKQCNCTLPQTGLHSNSSGGRQSRDPVMEGKSWQKETERYFSKSVFPKGDEIISREAGSDSLPSTKKRIAARNWTETENQAARHAFGFVGLREKNNQRPDNRPIFYRSFVIEREDNSGRN